MICPNMATMLAFIVTDLKIGQLLLHEMLKDCLELSFNAISVDGDTSTNDAVAIAALGTSKLPAVDNSARLTNAFKDQLQGVCSALAQMIVRDGEGLTKLVCIEVEQAQSQQEASQVARRIAHSPLVKTALFAGSPNWGRIACAIGNSGIIDLDTSKISIWIDDLCIMHRGQQHSEYTEQQGQKYFAANELWLKIQLGRGTGSYRIFSNDLSHQYITINAEYLS